MPQPHERTIKRTFASKRLTDPYGKRGMTHPLVELMHDRGLTQVELAQALGVSRALLARAIYGGCNHLGAKITTSLAAAGIDPLPFERGHEAFVAAKVAASRSKLRGRDP